MSKDDSKQRTALFSLSARAATRLDAHDHMPPLDGIRGLAVLLVVSRHFFGAMASEFDWTTPLLKPFRLGWIGVDLFFVLSGFLITGILYEAKQQAVGGYFKNFYARRALRIFPLYYLALLVILIMSAAWPDAGVWGDAHPGWQWVYLTNLIQSTDGWDVFGITGHFWSLAVEEHYYLVWPAVVFLLGRRALMAVTVVAMAAALALRLTQVDGDGVGFAAYVLTPMRMDSLAAGSFLALLVRSGKPLRTYVKPALLVAALAGGGFAALLFARSNLDRGDPYLATIGLTFLWALFAALILLSLTWRPLERTFSAPPLRWVGKISYGMYVWHLIVFTIVFRTEWARALRPFEGLPQALTVGGAALALMLAVTLASWHFWEKPFLGLKTFFTGKPREAPVRAAAWDNARS